MAMREHLKAELGGTVDGSGNLYVVTDLDSTVLFAAHLDTVHVRDAGTVEVHQVGPWLKTDGHSCLGADDGAGVWILWEMILRGIPGHYVFTAGEECGCVGAMRFDVPKGVTRCIEFDRCGMSEVIYDQAGGPTASLEATQWVCDALNMGHRPSDRGIYTDNAQWAWEISECVNVSVGYENQHSTAERLNVVYLQALLEAVCRVDWESMPVRRDPTAEYTRHTYPYSTEPDYSTWLNDVVDAIADNPKAAAYLLMQYMDDHEIIQRLNKKERINDGRHDVPPWDY
jgi:hypothetical protein